MKIPANCLVGLFDASNFFGAICGVCDHGYVLQNGVCILTWKDISNGIKLYDIYISISIYFKKCQFYIFFMQEK